jgi:predicted glycosyltransferase
VEELIRIKEEEKEEIAMAHVLSGKIRRCVTALLTTVIIVGENADSAHASKTGRNFVSPNTNRTRRQ